MKVLIGDLTTFVPRLKDHSVSRLADVLTGLGFEVESIRDSVLELSVTPNRGDAMGALGIARELAAYFGESLPTVGTDEAYQQIPETTAITVDIVEPNVVSQYHALVIEDMKIQPSTGWLRNAVTALGWRPINNLVDLTNVLMDRYGQPLHAFDLDAVAGETLMVRSALAGERIVTLDGVVRVLPEGALVIQDRDGLIDLAGIMGGASSEIRPTTKRVLLQAVLFDRSPVRSATMATGLRTQAAIRYERGVDPELAPTVLAQVVELLQHDQFRAHVVGRVTHRARTATHSAIQYSPRQTNRLLGFTVPIKRQREILERLGCGVTNTARQLIVRPPSWRYDLEIWQDLAEEIARLEGLNDRLPAAPLPPWRGKRSQSRLEAAEELKDRLVELGLSEVLTYSFTSRALLDALEFEPGGELANPLNPTLRYLRPSLLPNLAGVVAANASFDPLLLFEVGHVFHGQQEEERLAVVIAGQTQPMSVWLTRIADSLKLNAATLSELAAVLELSANQREQLKIRKGMITLAEWTLASLLERATFTGEFEQPGALVTYRPLSRFPVVSRDVALLVEAVADPQEIIVFIRRFSELIEDVELFDEFSSPKLGKGKKSIAVHIWYAEPTRTLTEDEVGQLHEELVSALESTFRATRR